MKPWLLVTVGTTSTVSEKDNGMKQLSLLDPVDVASSGAPTSLSSDRPGAGARSKVSSSGDRLRVTGVIGRTESGDAAAPLALIGQLDTMCLADATLRAMRRAATDAKTLPRRMLAEWFARERESGRPLPRQGLGYSERLILADAGVPWEFYVFDPELRNLMAVFGSQFQLTVDQVPRLAINDNEQSIVAIFRRQLDEMEAAGIHVPRYHDGHDRASLHAVADLLGAPRALLCNYGGLQNELRSRIGSGRLLLGDVFVDGFKISKARRRELRGRTDKVLGRYLSEGMPIPAHPERWDKIWFEHILDEAGIEDLHERDMLSFDKPFRRSLTSVMDRVGLRPIVLSKEEQVHRSYGDLRVQDGNAIALVRQDYRRANPDREPGGDSEKRYVANEMSYLNRFARSLGRQDDDPVSVDFETSGFERRVATGYLDSTNGNINYARSLERWRDRISRLETAGELPPSFHAAFASAMKAVSIDAKSLSDAIGAPRKLIYSWRVGSLLPTYGTEHFVERAEQALGLPSGTLRSRLGELTSGHSSKLKSIVLADGRKIALSGLWRYLPLGAASWTEDQLRPEVEQALERRNGPETVSRARLSSVRDPANRLPDMDPSCAIWVQFEDLVRFKTGSTSDGRTTVAGRRWMTAASVERNRDLVEFFTRWCALPADQGGLGLAPDQITLALVLNATVIKAYVIWRIHRTAHVTVQGKAIGDRITASEVAIVSFFAGLLDEEHGYLPQSASQVGTIEPVPVTFDLPDIRFLKAGPEVDFSNVTTHIVMSDRLVALLQENWESTITQTRRQLKAFASDMRAAHRALRGTHEKIEPILRHERPIAVILRMAADARKHVRARETSRVRHARDYQRIVAALMLVLVVFRSATLRNLRWTGDATGDLMLMPGEYRPDAEGALLWVPEHFDIVVDSDAFKNSMNSLFFGPSWKRRNFEKEMRNWGDFTEVMKHYLDVCRPILLAGRKSDLLFPPPRGKDEWDEFNFNGLVTGFTKTWCVYNPRFDTGMRGVSVFGPHLFRDIVATDILKNFSGPERWELAARTLATGVRQVQERYGWIDQRREISKADHIFDAADELARGGRALWPKEG